MEIGGHTPRFSDDEGNTDSSSNGESNDDNISADSVANDIEEEPIIEDD
jgi:hypothetical protein